MELVQMCLQAASLNRESVSSWRKQRRTLEKLPAHLAESLLYNLLRNQLLSPPLLEAFQFTVESLDLSGDLSIDAEWMAYIGGFRNLRVLKLADCKSLTNAAIWNISGLEFLEELRIDRCKKINNEGFLYILSLSQQLKRLGLSETGIGSGLLSSLSNFANITHLDLGGLPVTDEHLASMKELHQLVDLDLWGSPLTNQGASLLEAFPKLERLSLAWTAITVVPPLPKIKYLDIRHCTILSLFEECAGSALQQLKLSGAAIPDPVQVFCGFFITQLSVLELSGVDLTTFRFLASMTRVVKLDLSSTKITDETMSLVARSAGNLKWLDLSDTRLSSAGVEALCGHGPALEYISLKGTMVDDRVFRYLSTMPSLVEVDISKTNLTGLDAERVFCSVLHLQQLPNLRRLDLRETRFTDKSCKRLKALLQLTHLSLCAEFLTDKSLHALSALPNLQSLLFQGTVLTDSGLRSFRPPRLLKELDLTDCWLLTQECLLQFSSSFQHLTLKHDLHNSSQPPTTTTTIKPTKYMYPPTPSTGKDERIRYTVSELLDLRPKASSTDPLVSNSPRS